VLTFYFRVCDSVLRKFVLAPCVCLNEKWKAEPVCWELRATHTPVVTAHACMLLLSRLGTSVAYVCITTLYTCVPYDRLIIYSVRRPTADVQAPKTDEPANVCASADTSINERACMCFWKMHDITNSWRLLFANARQPMTSQRKLSTENRHLPHR
jgi:hypothetical protein